MKYWSKAAPQNKLWLGTLFLWLFCTVAFAERLSVNAAVEQLEVFVGESFIFQIQIEGSDNPNPPDLSVLSDFAIEVLGGEKNSSQSVSVINGQMTRVVKRGYVFNYRLTAKRSGVLIIPSVSITADNQTDVTQAIELRAKEPIETDDFKLRISFSKPSCYVGEPVIMDVISYFRQNIRGYQFTLPFLNDDTIEFADPPMRRDPRKQYHRIPLSSGEVIGVEGRARLDGVDYTTLQFKKVIIPKKPGEISTGKATVACEVLVGYKNPRRGRNSFFGDEFFSDFFGNSRRGRYQKLVVPSNSLNLHVKALPLANQPVGFAGHIGTYRIKASATPKEVNVGDPITLSLELSGPEYLEHVRLPSLQLQDNLNSLFKIPREISEGKVQENKKIFTQTIRALSPDVSSIPEIELPYFDTRSGTYRVATTEPIPLQVKATKILTVTDAEGLEVTSSATALEAWTQGIAHNYESDSVLKNQRFGPIEWIRSPWWISMLTIPPVSYAFSLAMVLLMRWRRADPKALRARTAYKRLLKELHSAKKETDKASEKIIEGFQHYVGDKLGVSAGSLTFNDMKKPLMDKNVDAEILHDLEQLLTQCEAGSYAGNSHTTEMHALVPQALTLAKKIEKTL